ncbi:MAG: MarR family transcriptional regulator [Bdellovibrionales bacterium]|nr:MarR family transcriptional regulator [Bdellovibrionales bacterium]
MSNLSLFPNEEAGFDISALMIEIIPRTMREIRRHSSFQEASLSVVQFRVLARLWHGTYTNKELADDIGLSVAAMSRLITGLVRRELLIRTENPDNRREMKINLTEHGQKLFQDIRGTTSRRLGERLQMLSPAERSDLRRALMLISRTLLSSSKRDV